MARNQPTKPPQDARLHASLERDLATVMRRCKAADAKADEAAAQRDRVIVDALDAKLSRARVSAVTGLSAARLDQIRQAARSQPH
jgi:hypothetical protein